jgi:class 3 adenylate cyclase
LGEKNKIHLSELTALQLMEAGKEGWLETREKPVFLEGEGLIQTYWLSTESSGFPRQNGTALHMSLSSDDEFDDFSVNSLEVLADDFDIKEADIDEELIEQLMNEIGRPADNKNQPLATLYKKCTILFAEVEGFTAWSAAKDPSKVFTLLEAIYKCFDKIAKRRKIFKVETIADCYVAACGLLMARDDHAIAMARFARECMVAVGSVVKELQPQLGAGSEDLGMRFGLHSGPVTAGVLRGEKCRFQLFGGTAVNTASRMETTGAKGKIQIPEETAKLLIEAGREQWLTAREEKVKAKGKGMLQRHIGSPLKYIVRCSNQEALVSTMPATAPCHFCTQIPRMMSLKRYPSHRTRLT